MAIAQAEQLSQATQRQRAAAQGHHLTAIHRAQRARVEQQRFLHVRERDAVGLAGHADHQRADDGELLGVQEDAERDRVGDAAER